MFELGNIQTATSLGQKLSQAAAIANKLLEDAEFAKEIIRKKEPFTYSLVNGSYVYAVMALFKEDAIIVNVYRSKNPWSKALGYWSISTPNKIFINSRKDRSVSSLVGTFMHEFVHYCSFRDTLDFDHGSNTYTPDKGYSAPYWIGDIATEQAARFLDEPIEVDPNRYTNIINHKPWYKRLYNFLRGLFTW